MSILTQRALVLGEIEATFGVDPVPTPADDAYLVEAPDFTTDITVIERNFSRTSLSPLPISTGRKLASMSFSLEVKGGGSVATAPRIGKLIRACGYVEEQVTANGTAVGGEAIAVADTGNGGPATTFTPEGTHSTTVLRDGEHRIRVVLGGITGVAEVRVTGGFAPEDNLTHASQEADAVMTETFLFATLTGSATGAPVIDDTSDPKSVTYTFGSMAGIGIGDTFRITVLGIPFLITSTGVTTTTLADDVSAAVDAHPDFGASNVADVETITFTGNAAEQVITTAVTTLTLGSSGLDVVPSWAGSQVLNDGWIVTTRPIGFEYLPISSGFESVTLYMYFFDATQSLLHRLTGAQGTFTVEGVGGDLAKWNFTFTGNYETVTDVTNPVGTTFEQVIPPQVELAQLIVNNDEFTAAGAASSGFNQINGETDALCAAGFTIDQANEIVPIECINEADSYDGVAIVDRAQAGTFDPQTVLEATHPFWNNLATAQRLAWRVRVGTVSTNLVRFEADSVQYAGITYADRNGIRVYNVNFRISQVLDAGDDELLIAFN